ncbi:MAG TPA: carboxypeptidase regulatory-like domain-containing protein [Mucilaginibacter sp.]|jgi:hypothetical protein|nr:carboxypeptidase regulatory-like domain-containing protein [Mucilaginibacter sp.]
MRHRFLYFWALLAGWTCQASAQSGQGRISGEIRDLQNHTLAGTTVTLQNEADTTAKITRIAGNSGDFTFNHLGNGLYRISCTHVGFQTYRLSHLAIDAAHQVIQLPVIILQTSKDQALKEVVITAKKPLIEQKIDRTVVNVDAMISAAGLNTLEALSNSPGVIVDANDNISLNGKAGVLVLIDDRPTYLSGPDLAAYLRSLPAGTVAQLELISNPPARYDASGGGCDQYRFKKEPCCGLQRQCQYGL